MLRLEPTDPAVRARTGAAVLASNEHRVKPTLTVRCAKCRGLLAQIGDVPAYGPLFTSSWPALSDDAVRVVVNGAELRDPRRTRWMAEHYETMAESGRPMDAPIRHAVVALLALPVGMTPDYPDLLVRCPNRHGGTVLDRLVVLKALREGHTDYRVTPTGGQLDYIAPTGEHLPTGPAVNSTTTRRLKADVMDVAEFEARLARRRTNVRDK